MGKVLITTLTEREFQILLFDAVESALRLNGLAVEKASIKNSNKRPTRKAKDKKEVKNG